MGYGRSPRCDSGGSIKNGWLLVTRSLVSGANYSPALCRGAATGRCQWMGCGNRPRAWALACAFKINEIKSRLWEMHRKPKGNGEFQREVVSGNQRTQLQWLVRRKAMETPTTPPCPRRWFRVAGAGAPKVRGGIAHLRFQDLKSKNSAAPPGLVWNWDRNPRLKP